MKNRNGESERADMGFDLDALLDVVRRRLGMEFAWVSTFGDGCQVFDVVNGDADRFDLRAGDSGDIDGSFCVRVLDGRIPNIVRDTSDNEATADLDVTREMGVGSYIGVPVRAGDDAVTGMLCCVNRGRADHLVNEDVKTLQVFADVLGEMFAHHTLFDRSAGLRQRMYDEISSDMHCGRIRMAFQPIVDPLENEVVGVEALCRIDGSTRRPDEWFRDAASVGIGLETELAAVAAALSELPRLPEPLYMSVNASPDTIADHRFRDLLAGSDPSRLVVEITEHERVDDYTLFALELEPLRSLGVRIAVDDVGAGFSSFAHVLELRPDVLKLDRSIVAGIDIDLARQAIASAVVDLGRRLDATVVAEGVETTDQLDIAVALGLEFAQGFLFRPAGPLAQSVDVAFGESIGAPEGRGLDLTTGQLARRFELAMQHSPVGMALVTLDGRVDEVNPAMCEFLAAREEDLRTRRIREFTHPDDTASGVALVKECIEGGRDSYRIEKRYVRLDGCVVRGEVTVVLVRSKKGRPLYFISQVVPIGSSDPSRHR